MEHRDCIGSVRWNVGIPNLSQSATGIPTGTGRYLSSRYCAARTGREVLVDFVSPEKRSRIMRGVKQKNTKPELLVRRAIHRAGYRFRIHKKDLPGRPDIVLPRHKIVIMVHGCFWHQHAACKEGRVPASNQEYWVPKLARNVERDLEKSLALQELGWSVLTVWACTVNDPDLVGAMDF